MTTTAFHFTALDTPEWRARCAQHLTEKWECRTWIHDLPLPRQHWHVYGYETGHRQVRDLAVQRTNHMDGDDAQQMYDLWEKYIGPAEIVACHGHSCAPHAHEGE